MGRFLKPRVVTRQAGRLVPAIDEPAPDPELWVLVTNGREITALAKPPAAPAEEN